MHAARDKSTLRRVRQVNRPGVAGVLGVLRETRTGSLELRLAVAESHFGVRLCEPYRADDERRVEGEEADDGSLVLALAPAEDGQGQADGDDAEPEQKLVTSS